MNRNLLLVAGVVLVTGWLAGASAQEKAGTGRVEAQVSEAATIAEAQADNAALYKKLDAFKHGKRDYKDGYVIMNFILLNYSKIGKTETPEAETIRKQVVELVVKHPDLKEMHELRLSEDREQQRLQQADRAAKRKRAMAWVPPDAVPVRIVGKGAQAAVAFQFKIAFYALPPGVEIRKRSGRQAALFRGSETIDPRTLTPKRILTFKRSVLIYFHHAAYDQQNILACTNVLASGYSAMTDDETAMTMARGEGNETSMAWTNHAGTFDHFCGVLSLEGNVLHSFKNNEKNPARLVAPVGISADGQRAAVMIGERIKSDSGEGYYVGRPKEVQIWEYPDKVITKKITDIRATDEGVIDSFYKGEL